MMTGFWKSELSQLPRGTLKQYQKAHVCHRWIRAIPALDDLGDRPNNRMKNQDDRIGDEIILNDEDVYLDAFMNQLSGKREDI